MRELGRVALCQSRSVCGGGYDFQWREKSREGAVAVRFLSTNKICCEILTSYSTPMDM